MTAISPKRPSQFSLKTFGIGLVVIALLYAALFGYLINQKDRTLAKLESRLASQTVLIDSQGEGNIIAAPEPIDIPKYDNPKTPNQNDSDIENPSKSRSESQRENQNEEYDENTKLEDLIDKNALALTAAPIKGFTEKGKFGTKPIKNNNRTPFDAYRRPTILNQSKPYIAVAINDFGLSDDYSAQMIEKLPAQFTFILSPYSATPEKWSQKARKNGHEVWLNLPMETKQFPLNDPGAQGLLTRVSLQYNNDRLDWLLSRANGYAGIAAFSDPALNNATPMFNTIAKSLMARGLGYFEINPKSDSFILPLAEQEQSPHAQNTTQIDIVEPLHPTMQTVQKQINDQGGAIITVTPSPRNITALKSWLETLEQQGIQNIPLSAIAASNKTN